MYVCGHQLSSKTPFDTSHVPFATCDLRAGASATLCIDCLEARDGGAAMRCVGGTRLPRGRQQRQVPPPTNAVKHTLNGALGTAPPLTISMGSSVLGRPKSEGGEGWPRHGNAAAEESACTQERPPLVSSSRLSASTTKSMGMELMRPYALWTAAASAFMSRYKGAAQGMSKTTCETPDNIYKPSTCTHMESK